MYSVTLVRSGPMKTAQAFLKKAFTYVTTVTDEEGYSFSIKTQTLYEQRQIKSCNLLLSFCTCSQVFS